VIFVRPPVADLQTWIAFYKALGFQQDPQFPDDASAQRDRCRPATPQGKPNVCWMTYIAADNVRAAVAMDELFGSAAARLADFPRLGKTGMVASWLPARDRA